MATLNEERKAKMIARLQIAGVVIFMLVACMNIG